MDTKLETVQRFLRHISVLALMELLVIAALALFLVSLSVKLNEIKDVKVCASFSSYGEALRYVHDHPADAARLDRNHDGRPCQDFPYGNI